MTGQERNEERIAYVIDLIDQIIKRRLDEIDDAEFGDEKRYLITQASELAVTANFLDVIMRTFDLPYHVDDPPKSWRDG